MNERVIAMAPLSSKVKKVEKVMTKTIMEPSLQALIFRLQHYHQRRNLRLRAVIGLTLYVK